MIKAVIFDLDNTLYDYDACNVLAEKQLLEVIAAEFHVSEERAAGFLKHSKEYVKYQLGNEVASSHNRLLYMQNICEQAEKNPLQYAMKFYDTYWNTMLEHMRLYDYVRPLLKELHSKNIKVGILTDLTAHIQYRKISRLGLTTQIDYLVTSEEAGAEKPSEKMFGLMLGKMKVKPEKAIMIGDSMKKDVEGAKKIGMRSIYFDRSENFGKKVLDFIDFVAISKEGTK
jgi:putative hydrolase of the HAD superfamily